MNPHTTWEQVHPGDTRGEALCAHCNAHNARELARCAAIGPECAVPLRTCGWVPTTECIEVPWLENGRHVSGGERGNRWRNLGRGDKISCGAVMDADEYDVREFGAAALSRNGYNVCRPFDEAWERPSPFYYIGLRPLCCEAVGGHPRIVEGMELTYGQPLKSQNFSIVRHTPPNHGHGAPCENCRAVWISIYDLLPTDPDLRCLVSNVGGDIEARERSASLWAERHNDCPDCEGTGRVICDDDRAGRVSPSHKAGGYVEWQRPSSVVGHVASQVPPELAGIYATDGDPATTERRR